MGPLWGPFGGPNVENIIGFGINGIKNIEKEYNIAYFGKKLCKGPPWGPLGTSNPKIFFRFVFSDLKLVRMQNFNSKT